MDVTECNGMVPVHKSVAHDWHLQDDHSITSLLMQEVGKLQFQNFLNEITDE